MKFGGIMATDKLSKDEAKRLTDLSKPTPLKSGFGGIVATDALKKKEEKRLARFTRRDKDVAQECPECEGFGYHFNNDTSLGEHCSNCVKGWVLEDSEDKETFNEGVKLGAGVAVGFSLVSIGIGLTAGVLGLIYERVTGE
jgi:uncharacterized protein (DUF983 family)